MSCHAIIYILGNKVIIFNVYRKKKKKNLETIFIERT